jgi:hypothetical protein
MEWRWLVAMVTTAAVTPVAFGFRPTWAGPLVGGAALGFASIPIHELGHALVAHYLDEPIHWLALGVPTSALSWGNGPAVTPRTMTLVCLGGPLFAAAIGVPISIAAITVVHGRTADMLLLGAAFFLLNLANLIPFNGRDPTGAGAVLNDGGQIVRAVRVARSATP